MSAVKKDYLPFAAHSFAVKDRIFDNTINLLNPGSCEFCPSSFTVRESSNFTMEDNLLLQDGSNDIFAEGTQEVVLGVSNSAVVTVWTLTGAEVANSKNFEHESRVVDTKSTILQIHCCQQLPRLVLLVCVDEWRILDACDCSTLVLQKISDRGLRFTGGNFFSRDYVALFTNNGEVLIYRLSKDIISRVGVGVQAPNSKTDLVLKLKLNEDKPLPMANNVRSRFCYMPVTKSTKRNLFRLGASEDSIATFFSCRSDAQICAWGLSTDQLVEQSKDILEVNPFLQTRLQDVWKHLSKELPSEPGFFNPTYSPDDVVTSCILAYLSTNIDHKALPPMLVKGTSMGDVIVTSTSGGASHRFKAHKGPVLSLLHPFSFTKDRGKYQPGVILTGGQDFAIRMWDLEVLFSKEEQEIQPLATFYNHAGPVTALAVGPIQSPFNTGIVLSTSDDGTVSVISPNSKRTLLVARTAEGGYPNTPATVHAVSWRLAEMMLLILSTDGSLTVWDIHTGQLERVETGPKALRVFNTGSDLFVIGARPPPIPLTNFSPINQTASAASVAHHTAPSRLMPRNLGTGKRFLPPLLLQSAGANVCGGPAAFVFHFDPEAIIYNLSTTAPNTNTDQHCDITTCFLSQRDCGVILKQLLSVIYPWSNSEEDGLMLEALQLPACPRKSYYGCLSFNGFLTLPFPSRQGAEDHYSPKVETANRLVQMGIADALSGIPVDRLSEVFPPSTLPIETLLQRPLLSPSAFSLSLLHRLTLHSLITRWQSKSIHFRHGARTLTFAYLDALSDEERRALVAHWLPYLPEVNDLAKSVSNANENDAFETNDSGQNSADSRPAVECCEKIDLLRTSINLETGFYDSFPMGSTRPLTGSSIHHYRVVNCAILTLTALVTRFEAHHIDPALEARDLCVEFNYPSNSSAASVSPCYDSIPPDVKIASSLLNADVLRGLATALTYYLDADAHFWKKQKLSVQTSPLRRTAIDFIGRGFLLWEPYLDICRLLESLLAQIADGPQFLEDLQPGDVFVEQQDVARVSRQALWRVVFTRPYSAILMLSRRLRAVSQSDLSSMLGDGTAAAPATSGAGAGAPAGGGTDGTHKILRVVVSSPALAAPVMTGEALHKGPALNPKITNQLAAPGRRNENIGGQAQGSGYVLPMIRAGPELMRVLTELTARRGVEMLPVLPELVELALVCTNRTKLKERGFIFVFPILQKFHNFDSHTRAQKACVGDLNGNLIFYDFKIGRCQTLHKAHISSVTAVCFNAEGRQLASYSMQENVLKTWQLTSPGIFGMGQMQIRALRSHPVRPFHRPGGVAGDPPDSAEISLSWPEAGLVNVLHSNVLFTSVNLSD